MRASSAGAISVPVGFEGLAMMMPRVFSRQDGAHRGRVGLEGLLGAHIEALRYAFEGADEVAVARIARVGQQPAVSGLGQRREHQEQRARSARGDEDAFGSDIQAEALPVMRGDRLPQLGQAQSRRVTDPALFEKALRRTDHRGRRREVRFADFHVDDVAPLRG